ncbi:molybdate ABC transporter substrate-binding protein [Geodermatophilus sp. DSM 44513]|uniref:molybdate ABC transporter substrate-binding protein n=1 Tax=Geodermatophilus sp. DSM 44513 TaxID=1528104 RepID=UPI001280821F|nr:molybdate ABC transporter substrate-binding protein [Geodermatophilus sp. DSM 44513]WNV75538.1 molybdate ABC transporter substrate-binding protein [Geodermatophilus sp. DSM 44513]
MSRRVVVPVLAALLLAGCGGSSGGAATPSPAGDGAAGDALSGTLTVFAAASLTDVFTDLGGRLEVEHPALDVQFNFAASTALATQVLQGAPADVFASAAEPQMDRVADAGLVDAPEVFAANELMLVVPPDDPAAVRPPQGAGIPRLADLVRDDLTMAVCALEVPCGAAAAEVLGAAGIEDVPDTYEEDVRAVLTKVQLGEVDAGLVYVSDVHAAGDSVLAYAFTESVLARNRYPIGVLGSAPNPEAARAFVDLVLSEEGRQVLRDAGLQEP